MLDYAQEITLKSVNRTILKSSFVHNLASFKVNYSYISTRVVEKRFL
jgi:hypothetical protein